MRRSLVYQIYPAYLATVLIAVTVLGFAANRVFQTTFYDEKRQELRTIATVAINSLVREGMPETGELTGFSAGIDERITIIAPDGTVIAETHHSEEALENHAGRPEIVAALRDGLGTHRRMSSTTGENTLYVAIPFRDEAGDLAGVMRVGTSIARMDLLVREVITAIGIAAILIVVAAGFMTGIIVNRIHRPLQRIRVAAARFSRGELTYRLRVDGPEEVTAVAETLNGMAAQLAGTISRISDQRNELEAVLSGMVEGVIVVDPDRHIRSMNGAARRLFDKELDLGKDNFFGRSLIEHLRNSELDSLAGEVLGSGAQIERTIVLYRQAPTHIQVHGTVLGGEGGEPAGVLLVLNDVTRLKQLENMRRDFVANVSHELRTPVTSILGFVETLREGPPEDPAEAARFLDIISVHANRLNHIIEDLLSLSRLESSERAMPTGDCVIDVLVERVLDACRDQALNRNVTLKTDPGSNLTVTANENLLEQALVNLVSNAVKYSGSGSHVTVHVTNRPGECLISVTDTGQGIAPADLPRIFERFYRVDRARSRELGGTGLGLAIVKHIALVHGGEVVVDSTEGTGSTFTLRLPQPQPHPHGDESDQSDQSSVRRENNRR